MSTISTVKSKVSTCNGELIKFKTTQQDLYALCVIRFDRVTAGRSKVSDVMQWELYGLCSDDDDDEGNEAQALMVYLVEKCQMKIAHVIEAIKRPHPRLGHDLAHGATHSAIFHNVNGCSSPPMVGVGMLNPFVTPNLVYVDD